MERLPSGLMLTEYREHGTQDSPNREVIYGTLLSFAEPGLIILPEVTRAAIKSAIKSLWDEGFSESLQALPDPVASR
jgi:hypothetical protein